MAEARPLRLLIVEDNVADVLLMREALSDCFASADITAAYDGEQALSLLNQGAQFDLIILDLNMPKVGGHTFLERVHSSYPPVAVFTSSWNPDDEKRALALGARDFVRKPISYDAYVNAVCEIVDRWGNRHPEAAGAC